MMPVGGTLSSPRTRTPRHWGIRFHWVGALAAVAGAFSSAGESTAPLPKPLADARAAAEKRDFATALRILRAEAGKGSADAAFAVGELLLAGHSGKPEPAQAAGFFHQAADSGHAGAALQLARLAATGAERVPKDDEKARFFFGVAAEAGLAPAQFALGAAHEADAIKSRSDAEFAQARRWYEKAADQRNGDALLALSRFAAIGQGGFDRDPLRAADFCRRAAAAGSVVAMNEMGIRYQKGDGMPRDNVAAIGWFTVAAQYDLPAAHTNLGHCYEIGDGVRPDLDKAGQHYAAAAKTGFAPAEFQLARLFEDGKGTAVDLAKAFALFSRAASGNHPEAASRRDALKARMSAAQLAEAEKIIASHGSAARPAPAGGQPAPPK